MGDFEKKLWKSDDVVLFGNLSPTRLGLGGGWRMGDFGDGGGRLGRELCEGEGGGEQVWVEVGVTKSSEFALEWVCGIGLGPRLCCSC